MILQKKIDWECRIKFFTKFVFGKIDFKYLLGIHLTISEFSWTRNNAH